MGQGRELTCVRLDGPISGGADDARKQATLIQRVTHLVRFQAHRSVELHSHEVCSGKFNERGLRPWRTSAYNVVTLVKTAASTLSGTAFEWRAGFGPRTV
jgi:hypothetical protein